MPNNGPFYPQGKYLCEVTEQALGIAGTGTTQFLLKVKVLRCLTPDGDVAAQYERTAFLSITEKTLPYLMPKLASLGYTRDSLKYLNPALPNAHLFTGQEVEMFCQHEPSRDGGPVREKWDIASGGSGSKPLEVTPPDAAALRKLDMLFNKQRASAPPAAAGKAKDAPAPIGGGPYDGISDDDVPF